MTGTAIDLGAVTSVSGPLPGATQDAQRGAAAYYAYVNSLGGVYGRKLRATQGDHGFDPPKPGRVRQPDPLYLRHRGVRGGGRLGCFQEVKSSGTFDRGYLDPQFYSIPNAIYPGSSSAAQVNTGLFEIWKQEQAKVTKIAIMWENVPGIQALANTPPPG